MISGDNLGNLVNRAVSLCGGSVRRWESGKFDEWQTCHRGGTQPPVRYGQTGGLSSLKCSWLTARGEFYHLVDSSDANETTSTMKDGKKLKTAAVSFCSTSLFIRFAKNG